MEIVKMLSIYDDTSILLYFSVLAILLGAVMGSFLNCAAWRMTHGESFLKGRSHCTSCGHVLKGIDLLPIFGWVLLRGKCRYCKTPVSLRYPLTECLGAFLFLLCLLRYDLTPECLRNMILTSCLFCLSLTDLEEKIIPDGCLLIALVTWFLCLPFVGYGFTEVVWHVLAAIVYGGGVLGTAVVMDKLLGRESMGGGDIKLYALMGLYLGMIGSIFALILSCLIGLGGVAITGKKGQEIPFGPAIAAAFLIMLFCGQALVGWYAGIIGV